MGCSKLLLPGNTGRIIDDVLRAWEQGGVTKTIVVVRRDDLDLQQAVVAHPAATLLLADNPPEMKRTVQIALEYLQEAEQPQDGDAWLLAPADLPQLSAAIIRKLRQEFIGSGSPREILVPTIEGRRGHPVLFPWALQRAVFELPAEFGINHLLQTQPSRLIPCAELVTGRDSFADLDTPEDYERYRRKPRE